MFCEWLGIDSKSLQYVLNMHRNKEIWEYDENRNWIMKNKSDTIPNKKLIEDFSFNENSSLSRGLNDGYITIGKGYP